MNANADQEVEATVIEVQPKSAALDLGDDRRGVLHISEYQHENTENLLDELKVGDTITVKLLNADRKTGDLYVSRKALLETTQAQIERVNADAASAASTNNSTLGDLLKQQMDKED